MFEDLATFFDEQPLAGVVLTTLLLFGVGQLLSWGVRKLTAKQKKRKKASPVRRTNSEASNLFGDYLSDFRILTEPERKKSASESEFTPKTATKYTKPLILGYELDGEWLTVSHNGEDLWIGSGLSCRLRLPAGEGVMEKHAVIRRDGSDYTLYPHGFLQVDSRKVKKPTNLANEMVVALGRHNLTVFLGE